MAEPVEATRIVHAATFSIVGRSPDGLLGVAIASRALAVGARCPLVEARSIAIANQAYVNPYLAFDISARIQQGSAVDFAFRSSIESDQYSEWRQVIAIGLEGSGIGHTGTELDSWAGHKIGDDCVVGGNLLVGEATLDAMVEAFESSSAAELPTRLVAALRAAHLTGGDRRGGQSAALLVAARTRVPYVDLRVDDDENAVDKLVAMYEGLSQEQKDKALRIATTTRLLDLEELQRIKASVQAEFADGIN